MPDRARYATWAAFILIGIGAWRVLTVVGATPLLGYANQFDMRRISACVGLWPDVSPPARLEAHPEAPIARYVRGERRLDECYWSSELLFVAPVAATMSPGETVDLRFIGAVKAATLGAIALALGFMLRHRPGPALVHGLVFALVVCDPIVTLWLNTLYTEFTAVLWMYASLVLLVVIGAREPQEASPAPILVAAFAFCLVGLGLSRQQHLLLPALLAAPVIASLWLGARRAALGLIAMVCAIALVQGMVIGRHPTIRAANNADVVLGAILPASQDERRTALRLGLPERCLQSVGATWYVPMGESLESTCPEALSMPRTRIVTTLVSEPTTTLRALLRGLPQLQDWRLGYLGAVAGENYGGAERVRALAGVSATSAAPWVTAQGWTIFLSLLLVSLLLLIASVAAACVGVVRRRSSPLALALYGLTVTVWYAIATAIFGDGYVEVARHAQLADASLLAAAVVLGASLFAPLVGGSWRTSFAVIAFAIVSLAILAPLHARLEAEMAMVPMGLGVVDRPQQNVLSAATIEFAGWALDPAGVAGVEIVREDGAVIPARYGLPYAGARGEPLSLYYPSYAGAGAAGFVAEVPTTFFGQLTGEIRTFVISRSGVRTQIDRRRMVGSKR